MAFPVHIALHDGGGDCGDRGPWFIGGNYYTVGLYNSGTVDVFKSADLATWAVQDVLHDPQNGSGEWISLRDGTLIHIIAVGTHASNDSKYHVTTFDTATDTWGASSADGPTVNEGLSHETGDFSCRAVLLSNGDIYLFYTKRLGGGASNYEIRYIKYSGGVWGVSATLVSAPADPYFNVLQSVVADANDLTYAFFKANTVLPFVGSIQVSAPLQLVTLTTAGVVAGPFTADANDDAMMAGHPTQWQADKILVPYYNAAGFAGVLTGTPLTSPVWTFTLLNTLTWAAGIVDNSAGPTGAAWRGAFAFVSAGTAYVVWGTSNPTDLTIMNRIYYSSNSGSGWSAPVLIWDYNLNPASWLGGNTPYLSQISAGIVSGKLIIALDINCEGVGIGAAVDVAIPLAITCGNPPNGFVEMAYTHTLPVSGGTGPYTRSITAGALPPGLALNHTTGVISGLPVLAGLYTFTVHVVDAVAAAADVTCSIRISDVIPGGGGSSNCTGPPLYQLRPCRIADLDARDIHWQETAPIPPGVTGPIPADGVDPPSYYFTLGLNLMGLWQTPTADLPGAVTYAYEPPALAAGGDVPLVPEEYHESLVKFATVWLRLKEGSTEFAKTGPLLKEFLADAMKLSSYVRIRSLASKYDSLPAEITLAEAARLIKQILPARKRTDDADQPAAG